MVRAGGRSYAHLPSSPSLFSLAPPYGLLNETLIQLSPVFSFSFERILSGDHKQDLVTLRAPTPTLTWSGRETTPLELVSFRVFDSNCDVAKCKMRQKRGCLHPRVGGAGESKQASQMLNVITGQLHALVKLL